MKRCVCRRSFCPLLALVLAAGPGQYKVCHLQLDAHLLFCSGEARLRPLRWSRPALPCAADVDLQSSTAAQKARFVESTSPPTETGSRWMPPKLSGFVPCAEVRRLSQYVKTEIDASANLEFRLVLTSYRRHAGQSDGRCMFSDALHCLATVSQRKTRV